METPYIIVPLRNDVTVTDASRFLTSVDGHGRQRRRFHITSYVTEFRVFW